MKPEAQLIAIAEACGWKHIRPLGKPEENRFVCFTNDPNGYPPESFTDETLVGLHLANSEGSRFCDLPDYLPDYLNDLNAMHEAEKVLTEEQRFHYTEGLIHWDSHIGYCDWDCAHATAAQRAEAFLRTLGKWGDSK